MAWRILGQYCLRIIKGISLRGLVVTEFHAFHFFEHTQLLPISGERKSEDLTDTLVLPLVGIQKTDRFAPHLTQDLTELYIAFRILIILEDVFNF